jgi:hypothetical protein
MFAICCVECVSRYSQLAEEDATMAGAHGVEIAKIAVAAATAMSGECAGMVEVRSEGYVISAPLRCSDVRRSGEVGDIGRA